MKAAGYIRVSDTSQIEGYSLDAQERLIVSSATSEVGPYLPSTEKKAEAHGMRP